jgi:hypothetical protein
MYSEIELLTLAVEHLRLLGLLLARPGIYGVIAGFVAQGS